MKAIIDNLKGLGRNRLIALGATGLGLMLALVVGLGTVLAPTYAPLYSDLSPGTASEVVSTLEQAGFDVDISAGGSVISVPQDDIPRARMALAETGLPEDGVPGWELFDEASGLGMNSFMQRMNRLRALEGELARSIQTIDGIDAARVHLVLPEREAFSRSRPDPSASVIVRGGGSREISRQRAEAIRALVAAAVPDLAPSNVTVLSASGETILAEDGDSASDVSLQSLRTSTEERMARNITEILTARVGAGNARVQVNVDLTNAREVIHQQSYDPSQQVVRSTETRQEDSEDTDMGSQSTDAAGNLPAELQDNNNQPQSSNSRSTTDEIVNYEIGNTTSEIIREPGDVERVSVAVLVNGIYNRQPGGEVEYQERPQEELDRLAALVRSAIGYEEGRGDTVSVDSLRFMDYSMDVGEPVGQSFGQTIQSNMGAILRGSFALALVGLVMAFGVRPLAKRMLPDPAAEGAAALAGPEIVDAENDAGAEAGGFSQARGAAGAESASRAAALRSPAEPATGAGEDLYDPLRDAEGDFVRLAAVQGGVRRNRLSAIGELVQSEPDESLRVLRTWLAQEA